MPATQNRLIVAASESDADLYWATHFFVPDPVIFIQKGSRKYLFVSDLEYTRAQKEAEVDHVVSYAELYKRLQKSGKKKRGFVDLITAALAHLKIKQVVVPATFPFGIAAELQKRKIKVQALADPFYPARAVKRADEIKALRQALAATERSHRAAIEVLKKSKIKGNDIYWYGKKLTSERLRQVIDVCLMEQGYVAKHTIVAGGAQGADPHCEGSGPLRAYQPIVIDVFPRSAKTGYHGDITRTHVKGRASDHVKKMYRAVAAAQQAAMKKVKHGVDASKVHGAAAKEMEGRGFKTGREGGVPQGFIHSTGHGLGLDIHEFPRVSQLKERLVAGHVITIEPGLYYPKHGGIRIEDVVAVTKSGYQPLTSLVRRLEIP